MKRVIVLDIPGLIPAHIGSDTPALSALAAQGIQGSLKPAFPAVTCPMQATLTTGTLPSQHGIVANGWYDRMAKRVSFWEQSAGWVQQPRIWELMKRHHPLAKTAALFFQQTMFAEADIVLSPAPVHTETGMIPWVYSRPADFYESLVPEIGPFNLMHYWGPMASLPSSQWIAQAAYKVLERVSPAMTWVYLPHLDYNSQRFGPRSLEAGTDVRQVDALVGELVDGVKKLVWGREVTWVVVSEYALQSVVGAVLINKILREQRFLSIREIGGRDYLDFEFSKAFAVVDHQFAHIFVQKGYVEAVRQLLVNVDGIEKVWTKEEQRRYGVAHERSGELVAIARRDRWFGYYWWLEDGKAPPFASTVDIHRKPGYDPVELFFDPVMKTIPLNAALVRGSHGFPGADPKLDHTAWIVSGGAVAKTLPTVVDAVAVPRVIAQLLGMPLADTRDP